MNKRDLLERLGALGFQLFEAQAIQNANLTLADTVKSKDLRLWEGFPVALVNSAKKGLFNYDEVKGYLKDPLSRRHLTLLVIMSLALYKVLGLKFSWANVFYRSLAEKEKKEYSEYINKLKNDANLQIEGYAMSGQRLKSIFNNYYGREQSKLSDLISMKDEFSLEYSLSEVFSPKQKELFLKKLRRENLTKTEKEYFSRAVKKKALALANPELHRLAQRLLET